jgi:hypothetical protein
MKLFAHRGWSAGAEENTISAFKKSAERNIDGIEFDIRFGVGKIIVVTHNLARDADTLTFDEALVYLSTTKLELLIECKEYSDEFYTAVIETLFRYNIIERTTLFAFPEIASKFPWNKPRSVRLGIIVPMPWDLAKSLYFYKPDMVLLGWGNRKERFAFKTFWLFRLLSRVIATHNTVRFVVGVAYSKSDVTWLAKQSGLYGYTIE